MKYLLKISINILGGKHLRYVVVSVLKKDAGKFNNTLRKDVFDKFGVKSSKLPAHFTIKSPFESDDISQLEKILNIFCNSNNATPYEIHGFDHFDDRVIYMKVFMSNDAKFVHDKLIDELSSINYIKFDSHDGKNKIFHVTISSKKIKNKFNELWDYVNNIPCDFYCSFDNISIYKWVDNNWVLHKEYILK